MKESFKRLRKAEIPVKLSEKEFNEFVLPLLPKRRKGPQYKISRQKIFNYILKFIYMGCQWKMLPIDRDEEGKAEIHYSQIFRVFQKWLKEGILVKLFETSVLKLSESNKLSISILHGDGTTTSAKKGGDCLGYSGHKHMKGEKIVAFVDRNCNVISPMIVAPANKNEGALFIKALSCLKSTINYIGKSLKKSVMSLDCAYDSAVNRRMIFNCGMIPNIKENPRGRKRVKLGRRRLYDDKIFQERFRTVERVFAWEDKFKRLLLRFERISLHHFGMKLIAYTMINLRHFCG